MFRAILGRLLRRSKANSAYPVAVEISERLAFEILIGVVPKVLKGLYYKLRLGRSGGIPLIARGVRLSHPELIRVGSGFAIEDYAEVQGLSRNGMNFGDNVTVGRGAQVRASGYYGRDLGIGLDVGDDSNISPQAFIGASGGITIGRKVLMGPAVIILSEEHVSDRTEVDIKDQGVSHRPTVVEDNVWIGARAIILAGVRVGQGAIIGAGSVVRHDVPPFAVVAGVPARVVRHRLASDHAPDGS